MTEPSKITPHATSWIAAWNRRDLDAILDHYAEEIVFQADTVASRWGRPDGVLRGKAELREHFKRGLELAGDLRFELEEVFTCPGDYAVLYRRKNGNRVIDTVVLDEEEHATRFEPSTPSPSDRFAVFVLCVTSGANEERSALPHEFPEGNDNCTYVHRGRHGQCPHCH